MRMYDLIERKKRGGELLSDEIGFMVNGYVKGEILDGQMAAMLMAVYFQGMSERELSDFTHDMAYSGDLVDLSPIEGFKVDKHSTGGVGDKTTLIIGPAVAACGVKVAKMSGRGLGHTGGTIDKLESIPGFRTDLKREEFFRNVNKIGISVTGQSGNLVPADKKIYALRDITSTVDSIPLIAASVMSKKLAAGSDGILLDVTCGSGAFMREYGDALLLAKQMVAIGENAGKKTTALITDMDVPLGQAIGNSLEVKEAVDVLRGQGPEDVREICIALGAEMLLLAGLGTPSLCRERIREVLDQGIAFEKFAAMAALQGGDRRVLEDTNRFAQAPYHYEVVSGNRGFVESMDTERCGIASMILGAGRETKDGPIDPAAGIMIKKKTGDFVEPGDTIAILYSSSDSKIYEAEGILREAIQVGPGKPVKKQMILARVTKGSVEEYNAGQTL